VAGLALKTLKDDGKKTPDALQPATRRLLIEIAARPRLFCFDVCYAVQNREWPERGSKSPPELARWLGSAPPSVLTKPIAGAGTVEDVLRAAVRGVGPIAEAARLAAEAVGGERVLELFLDLRRKPLSSIGELKLDYSDISDEHWRLSREEMERRSVRGIAVLSKTAAHCMEPAKLRHALETLNASTAGGSAELGMLALAFLEAAPTDAMANPARLVETLKFVGKYRDFAVPMRAVLERVTSDEVAGVLTSIEGRSRWMYLDLLDFDEAEKLALYYRMFPDEELTARWIDTSWSKDAKATEKILTIVARQYARDEMKAPTGRDPAARPFEFALPNGTSIELWARPPLPYYLTAPAWTP
jgi:hypothetical protein